MIVPFPTTAILSSMTSSTLSGFRRIMTLAVALGFLSPVPGPVTSSEMPTFRDIKIWQSADKVLAALCNRFHAVCHSSFEKPIGSPLSSRPSSNSVSPFPSSVRPRNTSPSCFKVSSASLEVSSKRSFNRGRGIESAKSNVSMISSSTWSSITITLLLLPTAVSCAGGLRNRCCSSTYSANSLRACRQG